MKLRQRVEIDPADTEPTEKLKLGWPQFNYVKQKPSVDAVAITDTVSWPSLSAQASQGLPAEFALLRACKAGDG